MQTPPFGAHLVPGTWWIVEGRVLGGGYPGSFEVALTRARLEALHGLGVRRIVCLQPEGELGQASRPFVPYADLWSEIGRRLAAPVDWRRHPIVDRGTPRLEEMRAIIYAINGTAELVYVHCWGGHGRTGTVAGCYLVHHGSSAESALAQIRDARAHDPQLRAHDSPETREQVAYIHDFAAREAGRRESSTRVAHGEPQRTPCDRRADRRLGAVLGAACGDALGTTLEFSCPDRAQWRPLLDGPHREVVGGGPFRVLPGQVTDDTQMACCLAASLAEQRGEYRAEEVARRYLAWAGHAFDIGGQTRAALAELARSGDASACGVVTWRARDRRPAGNGSLMRCMPIGAMIADPADRREAAIADSLITHADPRCALACARYVAALAAGIAGATGEEMIAAARAEDGPSAALLLRRLPEESPSIAAAREALDDDLARAAASDPELYGALDLTGEAAGFVRVAFRLAFWELLHAPTYEAAVIDAVNRGGDADTNGAIVGGLSGARHGASAIPLDWRRAVSSCRPPPPWDADYHPRVLLAALARASA